MSSTRLHRVSPVEFRCRAIGVAAAVNIGSALGRTALAAVVQATVGSPARATNAVAYDATPSRPMPERLAGPAV
jgi:hypothetical protein